MVFNFLRRGDGSPAPEAVLEKKASATGRVVAFGSSGRVAWSPRDTVSLTRNGFLGNPIGFRAVKLVAEAAAVRRVILYEPQFRYTAAMQAEDVVSSQFRIEVVQLSATYGPGLASTVTVQM